MSILEKRMKELKNNNWKLIKIDGSFIEFEDCNGYKYRKNIYNKNGLKTHHKYDIENPYHIDNINLLLKNKGFNTTIIPETYKGAKQQADFICGRCGKKFSALIGNIIKYKYCVCSECVRQVQKTKLQSFEEIKQEVFNCGYEILSQKWEGNHTRVIVKDKLGYKGKVKLETLRQGGSFSKFAVYNPFALENIRLFCKLNGLTCQIKNQIYKGWEFPLKLKCECGEEYIIQVKDLINDKRGRCSKCTAYISNLENVVKTYLDQNHIGYIQQKCFEDCKYKKLLPFDFYLPHKNICIEVQGEQHYFPIDKFGGVKSFELQQKRDEIKKHYCEYKNIQLIILSYKDIRSNNYKTILNSYNLT